MMIRALAVVVVLLLMAPSVSAQLDRVLKGLGVGQQSGLSEAKIVSGLKEALQIGTANAVKTTGRPGGYFHNEAIKILMPERSLPVATRRRRSIFR